MSYQDGITTGGAPIRSESNARAGAALVMENGQATWVPAGPIQFQLCNLETFEIDTTTNSLSAGGNSYD